MYGENSHAFKRIKDTPKYRKWCVKEYLEQNKIYEEERNNYEN